MNCKECGKFYMRQTKRNVGVWFQELLINIKTKKTKSPLAENLSSLNYSLITIKL